MRSWHRVLLAAIVLVAFTGSTWATCAEGALATATDQMACCKAGHDHCPMHDSATQESAAGCCTQSGPPVESPGTIVKVASVSAPMSVLLAWVILPTVASATYSQGGVSFDASPPRLLFAPPAYIAFSALLI